MENNIPNKENVFQKIPETSFYYIIISFLVLLILMVIFIVSDVKFTSFKSNQSTIATTFIILFVSLLIVGLCIAFLPNVKELKLLFQQISEVTYVVVFTIFVILFYSMVSSDILNNYYYIINPCLLLLGIFTFYKASKENYVEKFNINYERIKMVILLFCLITLLVTFYTINPGNAANKYFGYSLLITILISVFGLLYMIILFNVGDGKNKTTKNILDNFSSFGVYGSLLFVVFFVISISAIYLNKDTFFQDKTKSSSVIILLLITFILWFLMLSFNLFYNSDSNIKGNLDIYKKALLALFGLTISGLLIYWITYNISNLSGNTNSFILNLILIILILSLFYKIVNVRLPSNSANLKKNAFFTLLLNTILYIPCLTSGLFDNISSLFTSQYHETDKNSAFILILVIVTIILYSTYPLIFNKINIQGGKQLVNRPVYTDTLYNLATYEELNDTGNFDYQYAISCWIFIDAMPPNTNPNYSKFTSLLNFGNKPNILYNGKKNTLMVTMQQKDLKNITKNKLIDFDEEGNRIIYTHPNLLLQKWNNIIINYNGGTLDIFLNGELVKSSIEVVPYYSYDNLTIGENGGIKGGICNVVYFKKPLTTHNIYYLYNMVKNNTPPVLNDSHKTIINE